MPPASDRDKRPRPGDLSAAEAANTFGSARLELVLPAEWVSPSVARDRVRRWLGEHRWSPAHTDDLVLAVSEAVSNSIEHGYGVRPERANQATLPDHPGTVEVHARITTETGGVRRAEFTIRDNGSWTDSTGGYSRGHGLVIMRACVDEFKIGGTATGTTVVLRSRPMLPPLDLG
jgi:anti-sigma regulatory factor (Ser/Thr protein kinase)